jgi:hypothetical protein
VRADFRRDLVKRSCHALWATVLTMVSPSVFAYDFPRALIRLSNDYAECAAYFSIAADALRQLGEADLADGVARLQSIALEQAVDTSDSGVALIRMQQARDAQLGVLKDNYANLPLLTAKHADLCKQILEAPDQRLRVLLEK